MINQKGCVKTENSTYKIFIYISIVIYHFLNTNSRTINAIPFLCVFFLCLFSKNYMQGKRSTYFAGTVTLTLIITIFHGILEAKDFFILLFGFISLNYISIKNKFNSNDIYNYLLYIIIPISIISYIKVGGVNYIPDVNNQINIFGGNSTKHGTGTIGILLFIASGIDFYLKSKNGTISKKHLLLMLASFYIVFFSGSRSITLSVICSLIFFYINKNKFRPILSKVFFIIVMLSTFAMEYLENFAYLFKSNPILANFVRVDNFNSNSGITSGRAWLWSYHIKSFENSTLYMGGGRAVTDISIGDYIPSLGTKAIAAGESVFTAYIACYGIIGIILDIILISFFFQSVRRKNIISSTIMFCILYNTLMGCDYIQTTSPYGIILLLIYFSSYNIDLAHERQNKLYR